MKVLLLNPTNNIVMSPIKQSNYDSLIQDLELNIIFRTMSLRDRFIYNAVRQIMLSTNTSVEAIIYRQEIVKDCIKFPEIIREIYQLPVLSTKNKKKQYLGIFSENPSAVLSQSLSLLAMFLDLLRKLRKISDEWASSFESRGLRRFFSMIQVELTDSYLEEIVKIIQDFGYDKELLLSAKLGRGNEGTNFFLRKEVKTAESLFTKIKKFGDSSHTFTIDQNDIAGGQILNEMKDRVVNAVANAIAQSAEHIDNFFSQLQFELAFYVGCINLYEQLRQFNLSIDFPNPKTRQKVTHSFTGLYDLSLALTTGRSVVSNDLNLGNKLLVIITGANQGGKTVFLRSVGIAQIMMQCGMFVPAQNYSASISDRIFTHFKREEDIEMKSGKLEGELIRMNIIVDHLTPYSLVLCNESFSSTNEREGSEIAKQVVNAFIEKKTKIFYVTHLYLFASLNYNSQKDTTCFLRAMRNTDGSRSYKILTGEPLETSFGKDIYYNLFKE